MASDSRTHTPTLDEDDLETILSIARNEQSGRITRREAEALVAAYRAHDGLVEALRWALDKLVDARNVCYGGVEIEEIEARRRALEAAGITEATNGK